MVGRQQTGAKSALINRFARSHLLTIVGDARTCRFPGKVAVNANHHLSPATKKKKLTDKYDYLNFYSYQCNYN